MDNGSPDNDQTAAPPFDPEHRRWLVEESAISDSVIERARLYSIYDAKAASKLFGMPAKIFERAMPILVFPYFLPMRPRDPVVVRGRPLVPIELRDKKGKVSLAKYVSQAKSLTQLFYGPSLLESTRVLEDTSIPVLITEGERKCLAAESAGLSCIAISGVDQWHEQGKKTLHSQFSWLVLAEPTPRKIFLTFDRDAIDNKRVRDNENELGWLLEDHGAVVRVVRFPKDAPKLDDFLARYGVKALMQLLADAEVDGMLPPNPRVKPTQDWQQTLEKLRVDSERRPIKDADNIARVLMHHPDWQGVIAFDARRERQTLIKAPPFAADLAIEKAPIPRPVADSDVTRIAAWLVSQPVLGWETAPKPSMIEAAIEVVCERNRFDAVQSYLVGLTWDETPRLDTMGSTYFGATDSPYTRAVFAKWMISATARAARPGCQVDHVIVLEGGQGLGKSTALRILAGDAYFSDSLPELGRDALEHCLGPWLIELAELDHMRRNEATQLKTFISLRAPAFRSAYARRTVEHPRRCVFAGTTNESAYLIDPTGGRRFWPVACTTVDLAGLARDRDQLWAEAVARMRAGETWHLTSPDEIAAAAEQQSERRQIDPWTAYIASFVKTRKTVTVNDVLDYLGKGPEESYGSFAPRPSSGAKSRLQHDHRSATRVAHVLVELGWVRRRLSVDGARIWAYVVDEPAVAGPRPSRAETGPANGTAEVYDFADEVPGVPGVPVDPAMTQARDGSTPADESGGEHTRTPAPARSSSIYTGTDRTTGTKEVDPDSYPGPAPGPVSGDTGTPAPAPPEQLPLTPRKIY